MTVNYYQFTPCCQGQPNLYFSGDPDHVPAGVYEYEGRCYTVAFIFATYPEDLDPVPTESLISVTDCDDPTCDCCQCIRIRFRVAQGGLPVAIPARDCSDVIIGITVPTDGSWSERTCVKSWTADPKVFEVDVQGDCIDNQCPIETCFLLEDCEGKQEDIYASYASLSAYLNHTGTIKIDGFPDTCWTFREIDTCECAIEVTVLSTWVDCDECINCKGFKLTNCEDGTVRYTTNDLALYVDKTVELENCSGCWTVTCLEEYPPNDQNLVVEFVFDSCEDCAKKFYKLTPCVETPGEDPIFTDTDLSPYIGFILHLDGIEGTCWTIEEVRDLEGNAFQTVFIDSYYEDCVTCTVEILSCQCTSAVNAWTIPTTLTYTDCNGVQQETPILGPGVRSPKVCAIEWSTVGKKVKDIEYYGDCTEGPVDQDDLKTWTCPVITPKLRSVKPGYNTPGCLPDYFEKVSCNFAESLYKDVLADRYGITTNCSNDDFRKWEIKKELLDMAAITNPDYDCPPVSGCYDPCAPTGLEICIPEEPVALRCMSYLVERDPGFFSQLTVTYRDCNGEEVVYQEYWGESYLCYQFCALEEPAPVATILPLEGPNQGVPEDYVFDEPTRECTDTDADVCLTLAYINGTPGESGEISYVNCAGEPSTYVVTNYNPEEPPILCIAQGSEYSSGPGLGGKFIISDPEGGSALPCRC